MTGDYYWDPKAIAITQVDTWTPFNVEIGDIFTLTVNHVDVVSHTAVAATVADVTAGLVDAWNLSSHPYCKYITAADITTALTLTADTAGWPFTVSGTTVDGGGANTQALTRVATSVATGPNFADNPANWRDAIFVDGLPVAGSNYYFLNSDISCCWGLAVFNTTAFTSCNIEQSFTGMLGLNPHGFAFSADGRSVDSNAPEYRAQEFQPCLSGIVHIGRRTGTASQSGSGRINLVCQDDVVIHDTAGASQDPGRSAVQINGTARYDIRILDGTSVGLGTKAHGDGAGIKLDLLAIEPTAMNINVFLDSSCDVTAFRQGAGVCNFDTTTSALDMEINGGVCHTSGTFNVDTMTVNGGVVNIGHSNGVSPAIDLLTQNDGIVDASKTSVAKTITTRTQLGGKFIGNNQLTVTATTNPSHEKYEVNVTKVS